MLSISRKSFPSTVSITVDKWSGKSADGSEYDELASDFEREMNGLRENEINYLNNGSPKTLLVLSVLAFIAAIIAGIAWWQKIYLTSYYPAVGLAVGSICLLFYRGVQIKNITQKTEKINEEYAGRIASGKLKLRNVLSQWKDAKEIVSAFDNEEDHKIVA